MKVRRTVYCAAVAALMTVCVSSSALAGGKTKVKEYTVVGTNIAFDENGLPARIEGDIFYRGGKKDGKFAGTYIEELTPMLLDGNLIGTWGVSVFTFSKFTITTINKSKIVGIADGAFLVESTGQIVESDGTGKHKIVEGEFMSSSTIILGPEFAMKVELTLSYTR